MFNILVLAAILCSAEIDQDCQQEITHCLKIAQEKQMTQDEASQFCTEDY